MQYSRSDYLRLVQYRRALYAKGVRTVAKEAVLNNDALSPYYIAKISRFERFALNSLLKSSSYSWRTSFHRQIA